MKSQLVFDFHHFQAFISYQVARELLALHISSCQQCLVYSHLHPVKSLHYLKGLNKVQITQDKVMESVHTVAITESRTSNLGTTFLQGWTTGNARLPHASL